MSIDGVNNVNNNSALYAAGAGLAGGAAGGAVGYYTKSILKNGEPTDTFISKAGQNLVNMIPKEVLADMNNMSSQVEHAKSIEDIKAANMEVVKGVYSKLTLEEAKDGLLISNQIAQTDGKPIIEVEKIVNAQSMDELFELVAKNIDEEYAGKTFEELMATTKVSSQQQKKAQIISTMEQLYDFKKNKFYSIKEVGLDAIDPTDVMGQFAIKTRKALVDASSNIKGKAALIVGSISAVATGLGTFLVINTKKPAADKQAEDV